MFIGRDYCFFSTLTTTNPFALAPNFCDPMPKLWCYIQGDRVIFGVDVSPDITIDGLKTIIYKEGSSRSFVGHDRKDLILTKVLYHDLYVYTYLTNGLSAGQR
jgi:hypothetical protein